MAPDTCCVIATRIGDGAVFKSNMVACSVPSNYTAVIDSYALYNSDFSVIVQTVHTADGSSTNSSVTITRTNNLRGATVYSWGVDRVGLTFPFFTANVELVLQAVNLVSGVVSTNKVSWGQGAVDPYYFQGGQLQDFRFTYCIGAPPDNTSCLLPPATAWSAPSYASTAGRLAPFAGQKGFGVTDADGVGSSAKFTEPVTGIFLYNSNNGNLLAITNTKLRLIKTSGEVETLPLPATMVVTRMTSITGIASDMGEVFIVISDYYSGIWILTPSLQNIYLRMTSSVGVVEVIGVGAALYVFESSPPKIIAYSSINDDSATLWTGSGVIYGAAKGFGTTSVWWLAAATTVYSVSTTNSSVLAVVGDGTTGHDNGVPGRFRNATKVGVDPLGNIWVADGVGASSLVRKIYKNSLQVVDMASHYNQGYGYFSVRSPEDRLDASAIYVDPRYNQVPVVYVGDSGVRVIWGSTAPIVVGDGAVNASVNGGNLYREWFAKSPICMIKNYHVWAQPIEYVQQTPPVILTTTTYVDSMVYSGTEYAIKVAATNDFGESPKLTVYISTTGVSQPIVTEATHNSITVQYSGQNNGTYFGNWKAPITTYSASNTLWDVAALQVYGIMGTMYNKNSSVTYAATSGATKSLAGSVTQSGDLDGVGGNALFNASDVITSVAWYGRQMVFFSRTGPRIKMVSMGGNVTSYEFTRIAGFFPTVGRYGYMCTVFFDNIVYLTYDDELGFVRLHQSRFPLGSQAPNSIVERYLPKSATNNSDDGNRATAPLASVYNVFAMSISPATRNLYFLEAYDNGVVKLRYLSNTEVVVTLNSFNDTSCTTMAVDHWDNIYFGCKYYIRKYIRATNTFVGNPPPKVSRNDRGPDVQYLDQVAVGYDVYGQTLLIGDKYTSSLKRATIINGTDDGWTLPLIGGNSTTPTTQNYVSGVGTNAVIYNPVMFTTDPLYPNVFYYYDNRGFRVVYGRQPVMATGLSCSVDKVQFDANWSFSVFPLGAVDYIHVQINKDGDVGHFLAQSLDPSSLYYTTVLPPNARFVVKIEYTNVFGAGVAECIVNTTSLSAPVVRSVTPTTFTFGWESFCPYSYSTSLYYYGNAIPVSTTNYLVINASTFHNLLPMRMYQIEVCCNNPAGSCVAKAPRTTFTTTGMLVSVAGSVDGSSGDGNGQGGEAYFNHPLNIVKWSDEKLLVLGSQRIREVDMFGVVTSIFPQEGVTFSVMTKHTIDNAVKLVLFSPQIGIYTLNYGGNSDISTLVTIGMTQTDGPASTSTCRDVTDLKGDPTTRYVWFSDGIFIRYIANDKDKTTHTFANFSSPIISFDIYNGQIVVILNSLALYKIYVNNPSSSTLVSLTVTNSAPMGIGMDGQGILIAEFGTNFIRRYSMDGVSAVFSGNGHSGGSFIGSGDLSVAKFDKPRYMLFDSLYENKLLYFTDRTGLRLIYSVAPSKPTIVRATVDSEFFLTVETYVAAFPSAAISLMTISVLGPNEFNFQSQKSILDCTTTCVFLVELNVTNGGDYVVSVSATNQFGTSPFEYTSFKFAELGSIQVNITNVLVDKATFNFEGIMGFTTYDVIMTPNALNAPNSRGPGHWTVNTLSAMTVYTIKVCPNVAGLNLDFNCARDTEGFTFVTPGVVKSMAGNYYYNGNAWGIGTVARFGQIDSIALDRDGNIWLTDSINARFRRIAPSGDSSIVMDYGDSPYAFVASNTNDVYAYTSYGGIVRFQTVLWENTQILNSDQTIASRDGNIDDATVKNVESMTVVGNDLYWVESNPNKLRRYITSTGLAETIITNNTDTSTWFVAVNQINNIIYIAKRRCIVITTLSSRVEEPFVGDCISTEFFTSISGMSIDQSGNLLVVDAYCNCLKIVNSRGKVMNYAGVPSTSWTSFDPDKSLSSEAVFSTPLKHVFFAQSGLLYLADGTGVRVMYGKQPTEPEVYEFTNWGKTVNLSLIFKYPVAAINALRITIGDKGLNVRFNNPPKPIEYTGIYTFQISDLEYDVNYSVLVETTNNIGSIIHETDYIYSLVLCAQGCVNGTCVGELNCSCNTGYTGNACDIPICNDCSSQGLCRAPDVCECINSNYTGHNCRQPVCTTQCINGGTCVSPNNCSCNANYTGDHCQTPICTTACLNEGTCSSPNNCSCNANYTGNHCQTPICTTECLNGGTCVSPNNCSCNANYTGDHCQTPICDPICENSGSCISPNNCSCGANYTGDTCQTPVCAGGCHNGGTCVGPNICMCYRYSGDTCQTPICFPSCDNGGTCIGPNNCSCSANYTGRSCSTPVCSPECLHGGSCVGPNNCSCGPNYTGNQCQTPICTSECLNGGTCVSPNNCSCNANYTGPQCQNLIGAICTPQCLNGGCVGPNNCSCNANYTGNQCQTPICTSECLNGGTCDSPNHCYCGSNYTGNQCQTPICASECLNGGTCVSPNNCSCGPNYIGNQCQTPVCIGGCLHEGTCVSPNNCSCTVKYTGPNCEKPVCSSSGCNSGVCIAPDICDCTGTGYNGSNCITPVCSKGCKPTEICTAPEICTSTTTCGDGFCNITIGENCVTCGADCHTCPTCPNGYLFNRTTQNCSDINECNTNNGGCTIGLRTCINRIGGFYCSNCPEGYSNYGNLSCIRILHGCGDGVCSNRTVDNENCITCPIDCPTPCGICGDGECNRRFESCNNCTADCGICVIEPRICPGGGNCTGHGSCRDDVAICTCNAGYTGPACDIRNVPVQVVVNQTRPIVMVRPTTPSTGTTGTIGTSTTGGNNEPVRQPVSFSVSLQTVREINIRGEEVSAYDLANQQFYYISTESENATISQYSTELPNGAIIEISFYFFNTTTVINFADHTYTASPNEFKLTFSAKQWPFETLRNSFEFILDSAAITTDGQIVNSEKCGHVNQQSDSKGILRWYQLEINGVTLYGQLLPNAIIDGRSRALEISYKENGLNGYVTMKSPVFIDSIVVDPNYAVLIQNEQSSDECEPSNQVDNNTTNGIPTTTIIGIVVGVVGGAMLIGLGVFLYPKISNWWAIRVSTNDDLMQLESEHGIGMEATNTNTNYQSPMKDSAYYQNKA